MTVIVPVSNATSNGSSMSMKSQRQGITIRRNDRVLFVGKTGSGKTTTAATLLAPLPWAVVLDPKHQFEWSMSVSKSHTHSPQQNTISTNGLVTSDLELAERWNTPYPIIYRPSERECQAGCNEFWEWIWRRQNCIVYVDEVMSVIKSSQQLPPYYMRCVQMGRTRNIGVWSVSQRPARIPQNLISEAEIIFAFELRVPIDLKRVASFTDPVIMKERAYNHDFWYYSVREDEPRLMNAEHIELKRGKNGRT